MKTLISIDPGMSTGLVAGTYSDSEPFRVTHTFQIEGGVEGFFTRVSSSENGYGDRLIRVRGGLRGTSDSVFGDEAILTVLAEKFTARGSGNGFSYRTGALEPLRVEGAILALGVNPEWVSPAQQYFMGGKSKAEKLKARNAWLKDHKGLGYYTTGKDVGCKDADDARSALSHAIAWLRRQKHLPTLELFRGESK